MKIMDDDYLWDVYCSDNSKTRSFFLHYFFQKSLLKSENLERAEKEC